MKVRSLHSLRPVSFRPRPGLSPRQHGFTLVELMAVVTIIAVMVGLAGPAMRNSLGDARARDLKGQIINLFNGARARAMGSGRAQLVRFTLADNNGQGGLIAYEGNNSSCNGSNWAGVVAEGCSSAGFCTAQVDPRARQVAGDVLQLGLTTTGDPGSFGETIADICYEPDGTTYWRAGAAVGGNLLLSSENGGGAQGTLRGGFRFRVQRLDSGGTPQSVDRELVVPLGAGARAGL